jgi:trehalose 6-phosphate phosphatase
VSRTLDILARRHRATLAAFAGGRLLVAFDFDGTLAPIVPVPARARMRAGTRRLLADAARRYPVAVVSGRALPDVADRLRGVPLRVVFGNHGLEHDAARATPSRRVARWVASLRAALGGWPGVVVEDKGHSVAVHYRGAPDRARARRAIEQAAGTLRGARVLGGLEAVNVLPGRTVHKGTALRRAMTICRCERAIYVGDEHTDEDAFAALGPDRLLGVRVGASRGTHARFHLRSQAEVDDLLRALIRLRPAPGAGAGPQEMPSVV